jgi:hypothetical protein
MAVPTNIDTTISSAWSTQGGYYKIDGKTGKKTTWLAEGELEDYGLGQIGLEAAVGRYCRDNAIHGDAEVHVLPDTDPIVAHLFPSQRFRLTLDLAGTSTRSQRFLRDIAHALLVLAAGGSPDLEGFDGDGIHLHPEEPEGH